MAQEIQMWSAESSPDIVRVIRSRKLRLAGHVTKMEEGRSAFKILTGKPTNQNSIHEEIKCRLIEGNLCYYSVQTLLSSRLLSNNLKIKIYKTIILPVVLYGCEA